MVDKIDVLCAEMTSSNTTYGTLNLLFSLKTTVTSLQAIVACHVVWHKTDLKRNCNKKKTLYYFISNITKLIQYVFQFVQ